MSCQARCVIFIMLPHAYPLYYLPPSDMFSKIPLRDLASTVLLTLHMACCHGPWVDFRMSVSLLYLMVAARKSMMHTRRPTRGISGCAMGSGVGMLGDVDSAYIP
jgi:hypothetical protein